MSKQSPVFPCQFTHRVAANETLKGIGKKYGFSDPGPIATFPPNYERVFKPLWEAKKSLNPPVGTSLQIPWTKEEVSKAIHALVRLKKKAIDEFQRDMREARRNQAKLKDVAFKFDMFGCIVTAIATLGATGYVHATTTTTANTASLGAQVAEKAVLTGVNMLPGLSAFDSTPLQFIAYVTGPLSPSWWTTQGTRLVTGDKSVNAYGGPASAAEFSATKISGNFEQMMGTINRKLGQMRQQSEAQFYNEKINVNS